MSFGEGFNTSWAAVNTLSSQFQSQFTSQMAINTSDHNKYSNSRDYTPINGFYRSQINSEAPGAVDYSPSVMQIIYNSPDLNDTFRRLAKGLSNAIREGADNSTIQTGASGVMATYYRIQWPWIILNILFTLGGALWLQTTIRETKKARVPVWKSSVLALLSQKSYVGDVLDGLHSIEEMEAKASQHYLKLFGTKSELKRDNEGPVQASVVDSHSHIGPADGGTLEDDENERRSSLVDSLYCLDEGPDTRSAGHERREVTAESSEGLLPDVAPGRWNNLEWANSPDSSDRSFRRGAAGIEFRDIGPSRMEDHAV